VTRVGPSGISAKWAEWEMEVTGFQDTRKTVVTGVEMFKKLLDEGRAGDNVGPPPPASKR